MFVQDLLALFPTMTKDQAVLLLNLFVTSIIMVALIFSFIFYSFKSLIELIEQLVCFFGDKFFGSKRSPLIDSLASVLGYTTFCFMYVIFFVYLYKLWFYNI